MKNDIFYSFILRGELTKVSLDKTSARSRYQISKESRQRLIDSLCLDSLDEALVEKATHMALVYVAIAAFENSVREFVKKKLMENYGDVWWEKCVSADIQKKARGRKEKEEKIRWHTQRGEELISYTDFGDLANILYKNFALFEPHIISAEWAKQIFDTLEKSRNVIMHSGELHDQDIERIGTNIRDWLAQVGA